MISKTIPPRSTVSSLPSDVNNRDSKFPSVTAAANGLGGWYPVLNTYAEAKAYLNALGGSGVHNINPVGYITMFGGPTSATIHLESGGYIPRAKYLYYTALNKNLSVEGYDMDASDMWIFYVDRGFDKTLDEDWD